MQQKAYRSVGDIEGFVRLIRAACESDAVGARLEEILEMPNQRRRAFLHGLTNELLINGAPAPLLEALSCLADDAVAEKAYEVVFGCRRRGEQREA